MENIEKTVFISYRRTNSFLAIAIYKDLVMHGFDVFLDRFSLKSGDFEQAIVENIKARAHFLVILTPSALEKCELPNDWLRKEIELAIDYKRNIIPVMMENFSFGSIETNKYLTGKLGLLKKYNGLEITSSNFDGCMSKLRDQFLNISIEMVLHPVSTNVDKINTEQRKILELHSDIEQKTLSAQEWFERGYVSNENGESIKCFSKAIDLDPTFVEAFNNRGVIYSSLELHEKAVEDFSNAINLNFEFAEPYSNRGVSYSELGLHDKAIQDFCHAIEIEPDYAEAYNNQGNSYYDLGEIELAINDLLKYLTFKPDSDYAIYNLACSYALKGKFMESVFWLRKAITKNKNYCKSVLKDSDFERLRKEKYFTELMEELCNDN